MTVNYLKGNGKEAQAKAKPSQTRRRRSKVIKGASPRAKKTKTKCGKCGKETHQQGQKCPAAYYECQFCKKKGHYEVVCRKKKPTVHQASAELCMTMMTFYASEDGTVTYTPTHHISMISTVSLSRHR